MVVKVEVYHDGEQWCARGISEDIFTCSETLDGLLAETREAVACHFADEIEAGAKLSLLFLTGAEVPGAAATAAS
ncbi:MAG: type II toxin-antitoxin system HicB family antitoxin [candidate division WOR-3 bacterium]